MHHETKSDQLLDGVGGETAAQRGLPKSMSSSAPFDNHEAPNAHAETH